MLIKRISIGDFGIFREEKIEELNNKVVVIGGHNRAGKSTFLQLLRCIGFGFLKSEKLPPATIEYDVNYDIEDENGEIYNIEIKGNRQPLVRRIRDKKIIDIKEFYKLDYLTYKQLFTISLDELQNNDTKNNNMKAILLGAGFKEIVEIPSIISEISKRAIKIGGKNGNPSTRQFKEYNKRIKEGIEIKKEALCEVEEYYELCNELRVLEDTIKEKEENIHKINKEEYRLYSIKNNYNTYLKVRSMEEELKELDFNCKQLRFQEESLEKALNLKERYEEIINEYEENLSLFCKTTGGDLKLKDKLINDKEKILISFKNISGIKERIVRYREYEKKCEDDRNKIRKQVYKINDNWNDDFSFIKNIKTDIFSIENVNMVIDNDTAFNKEKDLIEKDIESLKVNKKILNVNNQGIASVGISDLMRRYLYACILCVVLGGIISFIKYKLGIFIMISGGVLAIAYLSMNYMSGKNTTHLGDFQEDVKSINEELKAKSEKYEDICKRIKNNEENIKELKEILDIREEVSNEGLKRYFKEIVDIKYKIVDLEQLIIKTLNEKKKIDFELENMKRLVLGILKDNEKFVNYENVEESLKFSYEIFQGMEKVMDYLEVANELDKIQYKKYLIENKICKFLGDDYEDCNEILLGIDANIREGRKYAKFLNLTSQKNMLENSIKESFHVEEVQDYKEQLEEYKSYLDIENNYNYLLEIKAKEIKELEALKENMQNIKYRIRTLSTTEKLDKSKELIGESRKKLKVLAKRYAALKGASYILEKLQSEFIEKTKGSLLKSASEYLSFITEGEYTEILPPSDLKDLQFRTVLDDGQVKESTEGLSRATKEQVFLAVRLSRINEYKSNLPIILDDSLVNFDEKHTKQTLRILLELSKTNQIFITTCHPKIIEYIGELAEDPQYLKLEKGKFNLATKESLIKHLS